MSVPKPTFDDSFASLKRAVEAVNAERDKAQLALAAAATALQGVLDAMDSMENMAESRAMTSLWMHATADLGRSLEATLTTVRAALRATS